VNSDKVDQTIEPWYWNAMKESYTRRGYIVLYASLKGYYKIGDVIRVNDVGSFPQPFQLVARTNRQDYDAETKILSEFFEDISFRDLYGDGEFFRAVTE
jgi:hypothetical protein